MLQRLIYRIGTHLWRVIDTIKVLYFAKNKGISLEYRHTCRARLFGKRQILYVAKTLSLSSEYLWRATSTIEVLYVRKTEIISDYKHIYGLSSG